MNHPYQYVQENVKYSVNNHRKNVLIVAHEFFKLEIPYPLPISKDNLLEYSLIIPSP